MSGALDAERGSAAFQASQGETKTHLESLLGTKLSPRNDDTDNTAPDPNSAVAVAVQKSDGVELDSVSLSLAATPLGLSVVWPRPSLPCCAPSAPPPRARRPWLRSARTGASQPTDTPWLTPTALAGHRCPV